MLWFNNALFALLVVYNLVKKQAIHTVHTTIQFVAFLTYCLTKDKALFWFGDTCVCVSNKVRKREPHL